VVELLHTNRVHVAKHTENANPQRRAIGIVGVSQTRGREGERFLSPEEQRERIEAVCERDGITLLQSTTSWTSVAARPWPSGPD
jgi:hypothetical protein